MTGPGTPPTLTWTREGGQAVVRVDATRPVWFVSDLHLGDGTPSDVFFGKDDLLLALCDRVEAEDALLVVNGDALDLQQAWSLRRIMVAHGPLLGRLSAMARDGRLVYVVGNHDHDLTLFRDLLAFPVCDALHLGDVALVQHGHQFDPYIQRMLDHGQWHTVVHHLVERLLGTWIRPPLGEFYTVSNRVVTWLAHKVGLAARGARAIGARVGVDTPLADELLAHLDFFCWTNQGDSMGIFRPALQAATIGPWRMVICGHSHVPGVVRRGGRIYANSGSWTFASSQYLRWDGHALTCQDWTTGRVYDDALYRPMLDGSIYERDFMTWWAENHMGWLRFREGEERRGRLRGWQLLQRERAHLTWATPSRPHPTPAIDGPRLTVVGAPPRPPADAPRAARPGVEP